MRSCAEAGYLTAPVLMPGSGTPLVCARRHDQRWRTRAGSISCMVRAELPSRRRLPRGICDTRSHRNWRAALARGYRADAVTGLHSRPHPEIKRRIVLEGLLFRVLEILVDVNDGQPPDRVLISGGVVRGFRCCAGSCATTGQTRWPARRTGKPRCWALPVWLPDGRRIRIPRCPRDYRNSSRRLSARQVPALASLVRGQVLAEMIYAAISTSD